MTWTQKTIIKIFSLGPVYLVCFCIWAVTVFAMSWLLCTFWSNFIPQIFPKAVAEGYIVGEISYWNSLCFFVFIWIFTTGAKLITNSYMPKGLNKDLSKFNKKIDKSVQKLNEESKDKGRTKRCS